MFLKINFRMVGASAFAANPAGIHRYFAITFQKSLLSGKSWFWPRKAL